MKQPPPASLILMTIGCLILVNIVMAQAILRLAYPDSGLQFTWSVLILVSLATVALVERTIRRWRAFLRLARQR